MITDLGSMALAILPEIGLIVLAAIILILDLILRNREGRCDFGLDVCDWFVGDCGPFHVLF